MVHFPEELINEILRYALRIYLVEVFTKAHDELHVPHTNRERRSKQPLLVCKRWHAIGIAYLYETVEINHGADMERLRSTIQSSSSDRLRPMVRNLRIDGGYGINLRMVTACTPNVRVLSLQLRTAMKYGTKGLPRALAMLNPTELYLHGLVDGRDKRTKAESNTEVLLNAMPNWTSLVCTHSHCHRKSFVPTPIVCTYIFFWRLEKNYFHPGDVREFHLACGAGHHPIEHTGITDWW